jgi:hypothetical protein
MIPRLRRIIVAVIIVSFAVAAIGGIVVLLGAELGETAARVLMTTGVVGAFSVAVLCCSSLIGRRVQIVGLAGVVAAVVTAALVLVFVWSSNWPGEFISKLTWQGVAATIALSFGSLLLLLADRRRPAVRVGLTVTLILFAVVLVTVGIVTWAPDAVDDQVFPRVIGISSILAALGAVVVPVMSLLMRDTRDGRGAGDDPDAPETAALSPQLVHRLMAEAERRGITVDELVAPVLPLDRPAP